MNKLMLGKKDLEALAHILGPFEDKDEFLARIKKLGSFRIADVSFRPSPEQLTQIKRQALFYSPVPLGELSEEQKNKLVEDYLQGQIKFYVNQVFS